MGWRHVGLKWLGRCICLGAIRTARKYARMRSDASMNVSMIRLAGTKGTMPTMMAQIEMLHSASVGWCGEGRGREGSVVTSAPNATAVKRGRVGVSEGEGWCRGVVTAGHNQANGSKGQRLGPYTMH